MCSISQIEVSGPNGPIHITSQQEVEQHLSEALALHFQLTACSPFLVDPLHYEIDLLGTSLAAQAILKGTFQCPASVGLYTQQLITILKIPPRSSAVPSGISQADFIRHWQCSWECTSSSYSGLHYGHYKESVDCPGIADFHVWITEMAFTHGYSLSCWQSSLQVLLEKKPGSIQIVDLHALGLLEANFNASMKILVGHCMVQQALQADLIPPECFGSVPGCCTIQVSFSCCLLADLSC